MEQAGGQASKMVSVRDRGGNMALFPPRRDDLNYCNNRTSLHFHMGYPRQEILRQLFFDSRDELESVLLRRLRCPETAADLSQEAFLRLCRTQDLEHIGNLKAYLFRIALNLVNDHFRSRKVREIVVHEATQSLDEYADRRSQDGETQVLDEERLALFVRALAELSPLCQRIFYLNRFDGLKHKEIAAQLGISIRTVEDNLKRALLHCGRRLEEL